MASSSSLAPDWATAFLERLPETLAVYTRDGEILFVNAAGARTFQRDAASLIGQNLWEVAPEMVGTELERCFNAVASGGPPSTLETYYPPLDRWFENSISLVNGRVFVMTRDITQRKRVEAQHDQSRQQIAHAQRRLEAYAERQRVLAEASTEFATAQQQVDQIVQSAVRVVSRQLQGGCYIVTIDGDATSPLAFHDPDPEWTERFAAFLRDPPPDSPGLSTQVARSGVPVLVEHIDPRQLEGVNPPALREFLIGYRPRSLMVAPITGRGSDLKGAVGVLRRDAAPPFTASDLELLSELTQRIGLSIENARAYEQAQAERGRAESVLEITRRLERTTSAISRAVSIGELAKVAASGVHDAVRADAVSLYELEPDGDNLRLLHTGEPGSVLDKFPRLSLDRDAPLPECVRTQTAIIVRPEDFARRYPASVERLRAAGETRRLTMACLPLLVEKTAYGAMAVTFYRDRPVEEWERRFATLVADHCALALARARAFTELASSAAQLDESNRTLAAVIAATPVAVLLLDLDGTVQLWNDAATHIFGWTEAEVLGQVLPAIPADKQLEFQRNLERIAAGHHIKNLETTRVTKHRGTIDVALWAAPVLHDDRPVQCLWLMEDISERKLVEGEREAARAALEHTAAELSSAYARMKLAERRKDEFLAMLGHELRNPLAPIRTALQLMQLRQADGWERERNVIERQVQHLQVLVDDLLDVSRITRGKIELKLARVDLSTVLTRAIEMASPLLEQKSHHLALDLGDGTVWVNGDESRLSQVFSNLLTNAAKYTEPGGRIDVVLRTHDGHVTVSVRDNGIGLDPLLLPHIFDLFVQAPQNMARSLGGLGLGLTIVRSLVELHGGSLRVSSDGPGQGSAFSVTLPTAERQEAEGSVPPPRPAAPPSSAQRVLIVDDNKDAAELIAEALAAVGHDVRVEHDGPGALRAVGEFEPHVVLLDIGLPVMDGYEVAQRIRELPGLQVRLIALTGYGQPEDRERALRAGFDDHLVKPVELQRVFDALAAAPHPPPRPDLA